MARIEAIKVRDDPAAVRAAFAEWCEGKNLSPEADKICDSIIWWLFSASNGGDSLVVRIGLANDVARLSALINRESQH